MAIIEKQEKVEKDFFGITDKKTAMIVSAGGLLATVGILAKQTKTGQIVYELAENVLIDKGKDYMNENTRKIIEGIQQSKKALQNKANEVLQSKGVKDAMNLFKGDDSNKNAGVRGVGTIQVNLINDDGLRMSALSEDWKKENDNDGSIVMSMTMKKPQLNA